MSRIGKRILNVPDGAEVNVNGNIVEVKGKKGTLSFNVKPGITVKSENSSVTVERENDSKELKQLHGTTNAYINNMIKGVSEGYKKELEINGVGYKFQVSGKTLTINAGYSHPVKLEAPEGITVECPSQTELTISGIDKQAVGQFAAIVREVRMPEPYKGKGIKYKDEHIRRKEGKKAA